METVQLISMLFDSMNSEYIQENIDKIIDLLGCAAETIEYLVDENRQFTEKFSALSKDFYKYPNRHLYQIQKYFYYL